MGDLEAARDESTPSDVLTVLGSSDDPDVRMAVAVNSSAPIEILERLAEDQWENFNGRAGVRQGVAGNPSASAEILSRLAEDADEQVRMAVAGNPSSPPQLLAGMADDDWEFYEVRELIASNPSSSTDTLSFLAGLRDEDPDIDVDSGLSAIRVAVAGNPKTPTNSLHLLAEDPDSEVREAAAAALAARA